MEAAFFVTDKLPYHFGKHYFANRLHSFRKLPRIAALRSLAYSGKTHWNTRQNNARELLNAFIAAASVKAVKHDGRFVIYRKARQDRKSVV